MAQCSLSEATFPAFRASYCKPQLQHGWTQDSNRSSWITPALGSASVSPYLPGHPQRFWTGRASASSPRCHVDGAHRRPIPTLRGAGRVCRCRELLCTHPSAAGTQPVRCKHLAAQDKQIPLSLCIVWSSSDSVWVLGTCPIALLLLPFLPGASRDSHGSPVWDLFGLLGLVQMLAGCYFGAWIRNSANTSSKERKKKQTHTAFTEHSVNKTRICNIKPQLWGIWDIWQTCTRFFMIVLKEYIWLGARCLKIFANVILTLLWLTANSFED